MSVTKKENGIDNSDELWERASSAAQDEALMMRGWSSRATRGAASCRRAEAQLWRRTYLPSQQRSPVQGCQSFSLKSRQQHLKSSQNSCLSMTQVNSRSGPELLQNLKTSPTGDISPDLATLLEPSAPPAAHGRAWESDFNSFIHSVSRSRGSVLRMHR